MRFDMGNKEYAVVIGKENGFLRLFYNHNPYIGGRDPISHSDFVNISVSDFREKACKYCDENNQTRPTDQEIFGYYFRDFLEVIK